MKKYFLTLSMLFLMMTALAAGAGAEETKVGGMTVDEIKSALGMSVYVQGGYHIISRTRIIRQTT